jgi:5-methyltetrahydrofolate--homocysteine methyltransferase
MFEILKDKILICDGAVGTKILKRAKVEYPELANLTEPEVVSQLHCRYIDAGADIITTNSFGANSPRLARFGVNIYELNKKSAQIAKFAKLKGKILFGSVGPIGLKNSDDFKKMYDYFSEQMSGLRDGGVDVILIETMTNVEEMKIAFEVARGEMKLPVATTMSFKVTKEGIKTYQGIDFKIAVREMLKLGAEIIGANCGNGFDEMVEIVKGFRSITRESFLLIRPSAGTPRKVSDELVYPETPDKIIPAVKKMIELGVNIIGGCCGTGPEHILVIRKIIDGEIK